MTPRKPHVPNQATDRKDPRQPGTPDPTASTATLRKAGLDRTKDSAFKLMRRYLRARHGMTDAERRAGWGLPDSR